MTPEELSSLPPDLQKIVRDVYLDNPRVWRYLLQLALHKLGGSLTIDQDLLKQCPGEGLVTIAINLNPALMRLVFVQGDENTNRARVQELQQMRAKEGKSLSAVLHPDETPKKPS